MTNLGKFYCRIKGCDVYRINRNAEFTNNFKLHPIRSSTMQPVPSIDEEEDAEIYQREFGAHKPVFEG